VPPFDFQVRIVHQGDDIRQFTKCLHELAMLLVASLLARSSSSCTGKCKWIALGGGVMVVGVSVSVGVGVGVGGTGDGGGGVVAVVVVVREFPFGSKLLFSCSTEIRNFLE